MGSDSPTIRGTLERWRRSRRLSIVGAATVAYLVGEFVVNPVALEFGLSLGAAVGFVLALGVVFGPAVAIGAGVGSVVADLGTGTLGLHSAFDYAATFLLVFVAVALWNALGRRERFDRGVTAFARFVTASLPALVTWAVVSAWGVEALAQAPFAIAFLNSLDEAVGALAVGLVTHPVARRFAAFGIPVRPSAPSTESTVAGRWAVIVGTLPFLWGGLGTVLSVTLQPLQLESSQRLVNRFGWSVMAAVDLAGPAGRQLLTLLGFVGITLLITAALKTGYS